MNECPPKRDMYLKEFYGMFIFQPLVFTKQMLVFRGPVPFASWWFQPIWKILFKLGILPQVEVNIKNIWSHHLVLLFLFFSTVSPSRGFQPDTSNSRVFDPRRLRTGILRGMESQSIDHASNLRSHQPMVVKVLHIFFLDPYSRPCSPNMIVI